MAFSALAAESDLVRFMMLCGFAIKVMAKAGLAQEVPRDLAPLPLPVLQAHQITRPDESNLVRTLPVRSNIALSLS